jgi:hypothetical protein
MAEIRCPMCGKSASDELEICPSCQARLKPLGSLSNIDEKSIHAGEAPVRKDEMEPGQEVPPKSDSPQEEPIRPGVAPTKKNTAELEFALPNWLRKLRGQPESNQPPVEEPAQAPIEESLPDVADEMEPASTPAEEAPDLLSGLEQTSREEDQAPSWLSNIKPSAKKEEPPANVPIEDGNWLNNLRGDSPGQVLEPDSLKPEPLQEEPVFEQGVPDWMKKLQAEVDSQAPASKSVEEDQTETVEEGSKEESPDWLIQLQAETQAYSAAADDAPSGQGEEAPNWLGKLGPETPATVEASGLPAEGSETPDWLKNLQAETQSFASEEPSSETESPDWLKEAGLEAQASADGEVASGTESETPDWLKNAQAEMQAFTSEEGSSETKSPDWLKEPGSETQVSANEDTVPGTGSDAPDWLKNAQVEMQAFATEESASELESSEELKESGLETPVFAEDSSASEAVLETPDWLKNLQADPHGLTGVEAAVPREMPDWLKNLGSQDILPPEGENELPGTPGESEEVRSVPTTSEPGMSEQTAPMDLEPDWLSNLKAEGEIAQQEAGASSQPALSEDVPESELVPDWLKNIDKTDTISSGTPALLMDEPVPDEVASQELLPAEMPDWLSSMKPDGTISQMETEKSEADSPDGLIQPAELPSWVQAMRPVESMIAEVGIPDGSTEQATEKAGPLAGLRGVLPATPGLGKLRKPLNYSIKLRVTEDQNQQAAQLEQMLEVETQSKPVATSGKELPKRILRWVVALLLILAVGLPAFSGMQITPPPSLYPPELMAAREIMFGLPANSAVLLVFDYEPAYSGELEVTAAPLVDNLLYSGARLAIVSTSPTGPALAEHFLKTTQSQHNYLSGQQYANLGYLAGGASGVLSFALNPSQTIPQAIDGGSPWQTPLLQDIRTLADFKVVIVLTDNADTARIWVEQTGAILGQTPLLMAISAQAEPMIRPYYDSQQIKGLVTGLAGGKAYEQALQLSGLGQLYWDSYSLGLFVAECIIIFGSLWSLISVWRNRKSAHEEEV